MKTHDGKQDDRPLLVSVNHGATRDSVIAELKRRFPVGHGREARDRIYENGIIMVSPTGSIVGTGCFSLARAMELGRDIGWCAPDISDLGPIG